MTSPILSLCLIARDAEATVGRCISSVIDVADEVVLVLDARTTDHTEEVARTAASGKPFRLIRRTWTHHFADARNAGLSVARGKWLMILDADDEVEAEDLPLLREALAQDVDVITFPRFLHPTYETAQYYNARFGGWCAIDRHEFILRRSGSPRFVGRVHEYPQFMRPTSAHNPPLRSFPGHVRVYHRGIGTDLKTRYYMALMLLEWVDNPQNEVACIYLAGDACERQKPVEAAEYLEALDPASRPFHPAMMARYWFVSGLTNQIAWRIALQNGNPDAEVREQAMECYRKAAEVNPTWGEPPLKLAFFLVSVACIYEQRGGAFYLSDGDARPYLQEARQVLTGLLARDPANQLCGRFLEAMTGAGEDRREIARRCANELATVKQLEARGMISGETPDEQPVTAHATAPKPAFSIRELSQKIAALGGLRIHTPERGQHGSTEAADGNGQGVGGPSVGGGPELPRDDLDAGVHGGEGTIRPV